MARLIGVVGFSGTGKTTAFRNMDPKKTFIIVPNSKTTLPFPRGKEYKMISKKGMEGNMGVCNDLNKLSGNLNFINDNRPDIKYILCEDLTHFFNAYTQSQSFRDRKTGGEAFSKWADFAADVFNTIFANAQNWRKDLTIIVHFHPEEKETMNGLELNIKTPGKLLDRDIDIPSYFTYVLYTKVIKAQEGLKPEERYKYVTNHDGYRPAKTPYKCFDELEINNDMKMVIDTIDKFEN